MGENVIVVTPILIWYDLEVGYVWVCHFAVILTLGQLLKDICRLPRPFHNKEVVRLEKCFETEYGFPSTHTMCGMLPFSVIYSLTHTRQLNTNPYIYYGCFSFAILVALSRLYLGVHSPFDIASGFCLAFGSAALLKDCDGLIIDALFRKQSGIVFILLLTVIFVLFFPRARPWRAGYGTSAMVVGPFAGLSSAFWYINNFSDHHHQNYHNSVAITVKASLLESSSEVYQFLYFPKEATMKLAYSSSIDSRLLTIIAKRYFLGIILIAVTYPLFRALARRLLTLLYKAGLIRIPTEEALDCQGDRVDINKAYSMEIPARILTFGPLCWVFVVAVPLIWRLVGLEMT